jgi:hypothetical protein
MVYAQHGMPLQYGYVCRVPTAVADAGIGPHLFCYRSSHCAQGARIRANLITLQACG